MFALCNMSLKDTVYFHCVICQGHVVFALCNMSLKDTVYFHCVMCIKDMLCLHCVMCLSAGPSGSAV
jgi:hypothetical protein